MPSLRQQFVLVYSPRVLLQVHSDPELSSALTRLITLNAAERGRCQNAFPFASVPVLAPFNDRTEFLCIWGHTGNVYRTVLRCGGHEKEVA